MPRHLLHPLIVRMLQSTPCDVLLTLSSFRRHLARSSVVLMMCSSSTLVSSSRAVAVEDCTAELLSILVANQQRRDRGWTLHVFDIVYKLTLTAVAFSRRPDAEQDGVCIYFRIGIAVFSLSFAADFAERQLDVTVLI